MTDAEINEAVAKRLGWGTHISFPGRWIPPNGIKRIEEGIGSMVVESDIPDYCHEIKAAWEIVDSLKCEWEMKKRLKWGIDFRIYDDTCQYPSAIADTAPMAVCLAFLKLKDNVCTVSK